MSAVTPEVSCSISVSISCFPDAGFLKRCIEKNELMIGITLVFFPLDC